MDGLFQNFEVITFQGNDVFVLRMDSATIPQESYCFSAAQIVKMITKDFLVTNLIFYGDVLPQGELVFEVCKMTKLMHDARKVDPKAPFCPTVLLYIDRTFESVPPPVLNRLKYLCEMVQCQDTIQMGRESATQPADGNSFDLRSI